MKGDFYKTNSLQNKRQKRENLFGYVFSAPQIIGFLAFVLFPLVYSIILCFSSWNMFTAPEFVGFRNFEKIFIDRIFWKSMGNTFIYIAIVVPLTLITSLTLAILTNRKLPIKRFHRAAFFLPMVTSTVAIAMVWSFIYQPEGGILNSILIGLGVKNPPMWLQDVKYARWAVSILSIWLKAGYYYIIFDAGLKNIPKELYEAADIDGASPLRKTIKITIPMLSSVMFFVIVMLFIDVFNMFHEVYVMIGDQITLHIRFQCIFISTLLDHPLIWEEQQLQVVLFILVGIVTVVQFKLKRRWCLNERFKENTKKRNH